MMSKKIGPAEIQQNNNSKPRKSIPNEKHNNYTQSVKLYFMFKF